jgi:TRAP-type C4-dicarboxylate transport system permease small subunit
MAMFFKITGKIDLFIQTVLKYIALAMFIILMVIVALNVLNRLIPVTSFHWLDEIVELCFAAMTFYGTAAVWIKKGHYSAGNWVERLIQNRIAAGLFRIFIEIVSLVFFCILLRYSFNLTVNTREVTAVFQIPRSAVYSCMPISAGIMVLYSLSFFIDEIVKLIVTPGIKEASG